MILRCLDGQRGKGIGQHLIAAGAEEARKRGCVKLTLEVLSGNEPARLAYLKYGFQALSARPRNGCCGVLGILNCKTGYRQSGRCGKSAL